MEIDSIFTERKRVDQDIVQLEQEIENISNEMTIQLESLDPNSRQKYQKLQSERQQLMELSHQRHLELKELSMQVLKSCYNSCMI